MDKDGESQAQAKQFGRSSWGMSINS